MMRKRLDIIPKTIGSIHVSLISLPVDRLVLSSILMTIKLHYTNDSSIIISPKIDSLLVTPNHKLQADS